MPPPGRGGAEEFTFGDSNQYVCALLAIARCTMLFVPGDTLIFLEHSANCGASCWIEVPAALQHRRHRGMNAIKGRALVLLDHLAKLRLCCGLETGRGVRDFSGEDFEHKHANTPHICLFGVVLLAQQNFGCHPKRRANLKTLVKAQKITTAAAAVFEGGRTFDWNSSFALAADFCFAKPKSAILGVKCASTRMLADLRSR